MFVRAIYILRAHRPNWVTMPMFKQCWQLLTGQGFNAWSLGMDSLGDFMARLCFAGILLYDPTYAPQLRVCLHPNMSDDAFDVPFGVVAGLTPVSIPHPPRGRSE